MKKTQEDDIKHQEMRKNFLEEKKLEDQKKHKELLEALAKLTGNKVETAEKVSATTAAQPSIADYIMEAFGIGKDLFSLARSLGPVLFNPVTLGVLGIIAGGGILSYISANVASDPNFQKAFKKEMDPNGMLGALAGDAGVASNIMAAAAATPEEKLSREKKTEVLNNLLKDAPWYTRIYKVGAREYLAKKGLSEKQINELMDYEPTESETTTEPVSKTTPPPMPGATTEEAAKARSDFAKTDPRLIGTPEPTPNIGQQLNAVTNENANMKLNDLVDSAAPAVTGATKLNMNLKPKAPRTKLPPVRNQEETFQRMIMNSTRVV